jgi:hypothetical protein
MSSREIGIAIFGEGEDTPESWKRWCDYASQLGGRVGIPATYADLEGQSFRGDKALKLARVRKKLARALEAGESFRVIGFYSVPEDFSTLGFDSQLLVYRCEKFAAIVVDEDLWGTVDWEAEIEELKKHVRFSRGEIFRIDKTEVAIWYMVGEEPPSEFETLKIIKRLNGGGKKRKPTARPPYSRPTEVIPEPPKKKPRADNESARSELIRRINAQGFSSSDGPAPVVALEDFFEGNNDEGSIGCNLSDHPGVDCFYAVLKRVRGRKNVQDVLVEISDVEDEPGWPFSERIYILTSASTDDVEDWLSDLQPNEVDEGYAFGVPKAAPKLKRGMRVVNAWWD